MRVALRTADQTYGNGLRLHTASSGSVPSLRALYLHLSAGSLDAIGEVRTNIAYLNHLSEAEVVAGAIAAVGGIDWEREPADLLKEDLAHADWLAPVRMLVDMALHDLAAKRAGKPLAHWLRHGTDGPVAHPTNQTLFLSSFEDFAARADAYVARGFTELKVRVGADLDEDLRRVSHLRTRHGDAVTIAADANGRWEIEAARQALQALVPFRLAYIEQPIAPGDWEALAALAEESPIPLMLDESVASQDDIIRICALGGRVAAHLKLVKLGGIAATRSAADQLRAADVPFMIGQMNEGGAATAAALHTAAATRPAHAELYGADGLVDDPITGLTYRAGTVGVAALPGLGVTFNPAQTTLIKEF